MEYIDTSKYFINYSPYREIKNKDELIDFDSNQYAYQPLDFSDNDFKLTNPYLELQSSFDGLFDVQSIQLPTVTYNTTHSIGNFNVDAAINELHKNVNYLLKSGLGRITEENKSTFTKKDPYKSGHKCGVSVRLALLAGGLNINNGGKGGLYGKYLEQSGWKKISPSTSPQKGDIAVTKPYGKHTQGHVSMFDGEKWVSDYIQRDKYVYSSANANNTTVYRYMG